jgi:hypothetical protein
MRLQIRFHVLCGLLVATAAHAGFIDDRKVAPPAEGASAPAATAVGLVASAATAGSVTGYVKVPGWATRAPELDAVPGGNDSVPFGDAIFRLLPEGHPSVSLDSTDDILRAPVRWPSGVSRAEALEQIAVNQGLNITFTGTKPGAKLLVTKAEQVAPPAAAVAVAAVVVAAQAPPRSIAPPLGAKAFEVRLADIRLSTAMARWAVESGVRIRWDADKHVLIGAPETFMARSVLDAVSQALSTPGIRNSEYPLEACEYPNQPPLIRITRQGDQAKDCPSQ